MTNTLRTREKPLRIYRDPDGVGDLAVGFVAFEQLNSHLQLFGFAGNERGQVNVDGFAGGGFGDDPTGGAFSEHHDAPLICVLTVAGDDGEMIIARGTLSDYARFDGRRRDRVR